MTLVDIASVIEGQRFRHDLGDIKSLAESMTETGLLHPIVVTPELQLVAGGRRLAAARSLGWLEIDATIVANLATTDAVLAAESDENTCRKDFTPTEAASIKRAREQLLRPMSRPGPKADAGNLPASASGRVRDIASRGTGYSSKTLAKVEQVQVIAENPSTPEPVRETAKAALAEMDRTGKVDAPAKTVTLADQAAKAAAEFPELQHYIDIQSPADAARLGAALRGYAEPERSQRRATLKKSIAADKRQEGSQQSTPDPYSLASRMLQAVTVASREIANAGGADTIAAAVAAFPSELTAGWADQLERLAATCQELAVACRPALRRIK